MHILLVQNTDCNIKGPVKVKKKIKIDRPSYPR